LHFYITWSTSRLVLLGRSHGFAPSTMLRVVPRRFAGEDSAANIPRLAQIERPGLPDEVMAEGMVRLFVDQPESHRPIDAARCDQHVVGP